jgi:hypothetical protein
MNFKRHVQSRIKIGKVYLLWTEMCSRDLHVVYVVVTTISLLKI